MTTTYASSTDYIPDYAVTVTIGGSSPGTLLSIGDIDIQRDVIEATEHSSTSNVKKKIGGMLDLGTLELTLRFDKSAASTTYSGMGSIFEGSQTVVVTWPFTTEETLTFSAFVSGLKISNASGSVAQMTYTLTLDGKTAPTWA